METIKKLIHDLLPAIYVALGWILAQFGEWLKTRREDKRSLKKLLFHLFEIHHLLLRCNLEALTKRIVLKTKQYIPKEEQNETTDALINNIFANLVDTTVKPDLINQFSILEATYQEALKELSAVAPVDAFYMSGQASIFKKIEDILSWSDSLSNLQPNVISGLKKGMNMTKPTLLDKTTKDFEQFIKNIAWKINIVSWLKCRKVIKKAKYQVNFGFDQIIDDLLRNLKKQMQQA